MARKSGAAIVVADSAKYPCLADVTSDFVYARLQKAQATVPTGYPPDDIAKWGKRAESWAAGNAAEGLDCIAPAPSKKKRDVFIYMINGAKERAPAGAMALIAHLGRSRLKDPPAVGRRATAKASTRRK
jgi:uncharacterized protein YecE (DUF72 family)